ncbi:MAG: NAD(+) diphosphatase [Rubrimonas sp.]|uniref:NAD(+) diphosphatase n=1 Tax=Rubrimonas sp. TaxID=2036015 RepID=UPI002FDDDF4D
MRPLTFAGGAVDRAAALRPRAAELLADPAARVLPLWRGKPLLEDGPGLVWLPASDPLLAGAGEPAVFLGMAEGPRFALDVSHLDGPDGAGAGFLDRAVLEVSPTRRFAELRGAMADLPADDAGDAATAKGVLDWHRTHPRCARCGAPTAQEDGGWRRGCAACGAKHFPRTDPVVIMLVLHGERVLLGRQAAWPEKMYSLLAGFMEPGETIEEAVRRETFEETSVRVGAVGYVCSQPWPFPASLMIGCVGTALSDVLAPDPAEIEDALWADRAEVAASLRGEPARFTAARRGAVARALLEAWVAGEIAAP